MFADKNGYPIEPATEAEKQEGTLEVLKLDKARVEQLARQMGRRRFVLTSVVKVSKLDRSCCSRGCPKLKDGTATCRLFGELRTEVFNDRIFFRAQECRERGVPASEIHVYPAEDFWNFKLGEPYTKPEDVAETQNRDYTDPRGTWLDPSPGKGAE